MADTDEDKRAEELLADAVDNDDEKSEGPEDEPAEDSADDSASGKRGSRDDTEQLGDAGKKALDAMKRERNQARKDLNEARKELNDFRGKLKEFEDKDKSEFQRLQEAAEDAKSRAVKAETVLRKSKIAEERAPKGATLAQIKAVAKRLSGDTDDELGDDADELFALLAPPPVDEEKTKPDKDDTPSRKTVPSKPRERLRGGGDPDEEPEENDPVKLADLIGRH
jgi:hypothetical protein